MRVLIYARLSRAAEQSTSIERQVHDCRELAARRWPGAETAVFTDDGVSGAVDPRKRPGFRDLAAQWHSGDVLVFWKIDRLARSLVGFVDLMRDAEAAGVVLVSVHDPLDLATPQGRMAAQMLAVFGEFERGVVRDRIMSMRRHLQRQGRWTGGRPPYGLRPEPHPDGGKHLVRDPEAAEVIRRIAARVEAGEGISTIAADLQRKGVTPPRMHTSQRPNPAPSAWSATGIRSILTHPSVVGHQVDPTTRRLLRERGRPVQVWEPIITPEEQARLLAKIPKQDRQPTAGRHWLYQVAKCATCGGNLRRATNNGTFSPDTVTLRCNGTAREKHPMVSCIARDLSAFVNDSVLFHLGGLQHCQRVWMGGTDHTADLARLREYLTELEEDRKAGMFGTDEGRKRYRTLYRQTLEEIAEIERAPVQEPGWQMVASGERFGDVWARMTDAERGEELRSWGITVTVSRPAVKRARVPISDRARMDWGELADAALEMAGVAEAELFGE